MFEGKLLTKDCVTQNKLLYLLLLPFKIELYNLLPGLV